MENPTASDHNPDLMNDPQYETNSRDDGSNEPDTCRICRGEATDQEPLFYPCKCNGSIKFVHQDCLMEWLSHSQKKHCELCKTPFRFTKLYSPHMPQQLPLHIFAHRLLIHGIKFGATSLRFLLVAFVWLGWLPWAMRAVWRMLFWFADGGWTSRASISGHTKTSMRALEMAHAQLENLSATIIASGISPLPENSLQPQTTTSASVGDIMALLPSLMEPFSQTLNTTAGENMVWTMFKNFFYGIGLHMTSSLPESPFKNSTLTPSASKPLSSGQPSLLSEVNFLKNFTRWPGINKMLISVLEGQIITVVVVVCFILIFLIREWVVQQQPGINMGAGFNAEFALPGREEANDHEIAVQPHDDHLEPAAENDADFQEFDAPDRVQDVAQALVVGRRIAQPRRRIVRFDDEVREEPEQNEPPPYDARPLRNAIAQRAQPQGMLPDSAGSLGTPSERQQEGAFLSAEDVSFSNGTENQRLAPPETPLQRPGMPTRDALSPAAEIQRRLVEEAGQPRPANLEDRLDVKEFLAIYRRAEGNPDEVLKIMAAEGQEQRLSYWVKAMKSLQKTPSTHPLGRRSSNDSLAAHASDGSNESWIDVPEPLQTRKSSNIDSKLEASPSRSIRSIDTGEAVDTKGKGKAVGSPALTASSLLPEMVGTWSFPTIEENSPSLGGGESLNPLSKDILPKSTDISPFSKHKPQRGFDESGARENSLVSYNTWDFPSQFPNANPAEEPSYESPGASTSIETWKEMQDARVQEAMARAREQLNSGRSTSVDFGMEGSQPKGSSEAVQESALPMHSKSEEYDIANTIKTDLDSISEASLEDPFDDFENDDAVVHDGDFPDLSSDDEFAEEPAAEAPEPNPFRPEGVLPPEREPIVQRQVEEVGLMGRIANWLWGDMAAGQPHEELPGNDEHVVQDIAAEAPFVPVAHAPNRDLRAEAEQADQNLEVLEAAIAAGIDPNDPDALDEAEDFDGIMELIGMRGPLTGLLQNGMFSAVLISLTVSCGLWIPYNFGRLVLLLLAHPVSAAKLPVKLVFSCAELMIDMSLVAVGFISYLVLCIAALPAALVSIASASVGSPTFITVSTFGSQAWQISVEACSRITNGFLSNLWHIADSEVPAFSATSHESLLILKSWLFNSVIWTARMLAMLSEPKFLATQAIDQFSRCGSYISSVRDVLSTVPGLLLDRSSWIINLNLPERLTPLDPELATWSGIDRFWAIFAGYTALSVLGALYLRRGVPFSTGRTGKDYEAYIADILNQAGGVMKVILIISIEMLVFPLYCGLLLDFALLPLFENATFMSRILFTINSPLTSMFVHWFVGTCYMFHFALFVSMCRKIMRNGVLYFIRDPDDPTFHPVRDVLERNVYTQLRKITFSALVYGALVIICLGGVVWGLAFTFRGVLPIHWSSNEPVLEFPIDLLFYNFMMPIAVRFFKPSDGLHAMYSWWFRKCARMLRLTWFLFDERKKDEEGHHVYRRWYQRFTGVKADVEAMNLYRAFGQDPFEHEEDLQAYFVKDGKYVRTPASDGVRIPKGAKVFLEVTEDDRRKDGKLDLESSLHGRGQFKKVYIPPLFRLRIFLFILSIWLFAALTGVCITIVPLVFGREIFKLVIPDHLRMNDIYAFSIGIYILGSILYCSLHVSRFLSWAETTFTRFIRTTNPVDLFHRSTTFLSRALKVAYLYSSFTLLLPTLFAMIIEFYLIIPLHTYFSGGQDRHITHFIQSWTLGLLYVKLAARFILWHNESRAARALRQIVREPNNYLNPNIRIATRFFILPAVITSMMALLSPLVLGWITTKFIAGMSNTGMVDEVQTILVYRYSYPGILVAIAAGWLALGALGIMRGWRTRIRDEVYLIGERLHNFGEGKRKGSSVGAVRGVVQGVGRRVDT